MQWLHSASLGFTRACINTFLFLRHLLLVVLRRQGIVAQPNVRRSCQQGGTSSHSILRKKIHNAPSADHQLSNNGHLSAPSEKFPNIDHNTPQGKECFWQGETTSTKGGERGSGRVGANPQKLSQYFGHTNINMWNPRHKSWCTKDLVTLLDYQVSIPTAHTITDQTNQTS